jgi:hypothetical protein
MSPADVPGVLPLIRGIDGRARSLALCLEYPVGEVHRQHVLLKRHPCFSVPSSRYSRSNSLFCSTNSLIRATGFAVLIRRGAVSLCAKRPSARPFLPLGETNACPIPEEFAVCREFEAETSPYQTGPTTSLLCLPCLVPCHRTAPS